MSKKPIPKSWFEYADIGEVVDGTRFIPFKAPVSEERFEAMAVSREHWFTVDDLIKKVESKHKKLGLVVCCCSATSFYDPVQLNERGIKHVQIKNVLEHTETFVRTVDKFMQEISNPDVLIGVHCLHGLNRTGYLICAYMALKMRIPVVDAIRRFENARGHEIETTKRVLLKRFA